jgi:N utilization substance protein A
MAAKSELIIVLEQIEREKGIPKNEILQMIESAVVSSLRKYVGKNAVIEAAIDPETAQFQACIVKKVAEAVADAEIEMTLEEALRHKPDAQIGDEIRLPAPAADFARIAAQTAKQLLTQKVRESERDKLYGEFKPREGQIITGSVHRFLDRTIIVDLGKVEAVMPMREQIRRERYGLGTSVRAVILRVDRASQAPQILLSRAAPLFLERLLELEVPEIKEKIIEILSVVREPGFRAKVLVKSNDPRVDPVGACVGLRGSRIRSLMGELTGEKIDLIPYAEDPSTLIANALAPAVVSEIRILDMLGKRAEAFVPEAQVAVAIGKEGQNLELACRLIGWKIEVKARAVPVEAKVASDMNFDLIQLEGVGPKIAESLLLSGFSDIRKLAEQSLESLSQVEGVGEKTAAKLIANAKAHLQKNSL